MSKKKSEFKILEIVVPFWGSIKFKGGKATKALLEIGPNVVDPKAIAEAQIGKREARELRDLLDRFIDSENLEILALYVRDPKKPIENKTLFDLAEEMEEGEDADS